MFESVILGVLGSLLGLALAYGALRVLVALAPTGLPRIHEIGIDLPVLLFTFAIALFSSVLFGSIPVFKYAGAHLNTGLREGGRALSQSRQQHRARNMLVVQVGLALVLLICSGLMIRTFRALMHVPPGFTAPDSVQTFRFYVPETEIPDSDRERLVRMEQGIVGKLAATTGRFVGEFFERYSDGRAQLERRLICGRPRICGRRAATDPAVQVRCAGIFGDDGDTVGCGTRYHLGRHLSENSGGDDF